MSEKTLDAHGRWRSVTVSFRVSPEEAALLNAQASASGLTKQEYLTTRALQREVVVVPSSRLQKALSDLMSCIYAELRRIDEASEITPELEAVVSILAAEFALLGVEAPESKLKQERTAINMLQREDTRADRTDQSAASSPHHAYSNSCGKDGGHHEH